MDRGRFCLERQGGDQWKTSTDPLVINALASVFFTRRANRVGGFRLRVSAPPHRLGPLYLLVIRDGAFHIDKAFSDLTVRVKASG